MVCVISQTIHVWNSLWVHQWVSCLQSLGLQSYRIVSFRWDDRCPGGFGGFSHTEPVWRSPGTPDGHGWSEAHGFPLQLRIRRIRPRPAGWRPIADIQPAEIGLGMVNGRNRRGVWAE